MPASSNLWLSRFAKFCAIAVVPLIFWGSLVTTYGAGLAVPDWPLSFGSLNPDGWWRQWDVALEHGHRLLGAFVGILVTILVVWTWKAESRSWVRWLAVAVFLSVVIQGVIGGTRVTERSTVLAVIHGCFAQAVFCLFIILAIVLSPRWGAAMRAPRSHRLGPARTASITLVALIFCQLIAGAIMRHYHAGMAIPTFPLAFGKWVPAFDNFGIAINYSHRVGAVIVTLAILWLLAVVLRDAREESRLVTPAAALVGLVIFQIALAAHIIWLGRPPVATSFHVLNGALILGVSALTATRAMLLASRAGELDMAPACNPAEAAA